MDENILQDAGLTPVEAKVYLTLLEHGALLAGVISRKSGVHRRSVYDVMDRLIEKGLVSYIVKNNRRYYEATDPKRFREILNEKQERIEKILPKLESKFEVAKEKQETLFFRGREGLKVIFQDHLDVGKEILVLAAAKFNDVVSPLFWKKYAADRKRRGIRQRVIYHQNAIDRSRSPLCKKRWIDQYSESPVSTAIYGDRVTMVIWAREPYAILIKDRAVANTFRANFESLWKISRKL